MDSSGNYNEQIPYNETTTDINSEEISEERRVLLADERQRKITEDKFEQIIETVIQIRRFVGMNADPQVIRSMNKLFAEDHPTIFQMALEDSEAPLRLRQIKMLREKKKKGELNHYTASGAFGQVLANHYYPKNSKNSK